MQTILGAGGAIGQELAGILARYTNHVRLVSRSPKKLNPDDELFAADVTQKDQVEKAIEGSEVVYLVVGLEYKTRIWQEFWPNIMQNVLEACERTGSKLVFFDNVYMYDPDHLGHMTEETLVCPVSRKGMVRQKVAQMLTDAMDEGRIKGAIARAADFFGPKNSLFSEMIIPNVAKGKKAMWFCDADQVHSLTYTKDAAEGTAILGNAEEANGEVWHLPTSPDKLTGRQWIEEVGKALDKEPRIGEMPLWLMKLLGLFVPILREFKEMAYQYERPYYFDSSKFQKQFAYQPTTPENAVRETLEKMGYLNAKG